MTEFNRENHEHLGDGVYIEYVPESYAEIILRANDHRDEHCTDKIFLDEVVLGNLLGWLRHKGIIKIEPETVMRVMKQDEYLESLKKMDAPNSLQEGADAS